MTKDNDSEAKRSLTTYGKYTGMAFQMVAIIFVFSYIGYWLDGHYEHKVKWAAAIGGVVGVCFSIYNVIRQLKQ